MNPYLDKSESSEIADVFAMRVKRSGPIPYLTPLLDPLTTKVCQQRLSTSHTCRHEYKLLQSKFSHRVNCVLRKGLISCLGDTGARISCPITLPKTSAVQSYAPDAMALTEWKHERLPHRRAHWPSVDENERKPRSARALMIKGHRTICRTIVTVEELGTVDRAVRVRHLLLWTWVRADERSR